MDAVNDDYAEYRAFLSKFLKTIDPLDQLPFRVAGYCLKEQEVYGEVLDWLMVYLSYPKNCPITLKNYLMQTALTRTLEKCKSTPRDCGFDEERQIYQPLKLVRVVTQTVNELVRELEDNARLYDVPLPPTSANASELSKIRQPPKFSTDAIKNSRRTMEDRHVIINDFNTLFNVQDTEPTFYYGIFDGHNGTDAATYANSHLNYNISVHPKYPVDIETAMREAFLTTDIGFLKKAKTENLNSGTTALCAIYRKLEKKLFVGWCGDSQALIARLGNVRQIVKKHSPEEVSERIRIEKLGGCILYWSGSYRVNGSLAVSRAIGDMAHKPFVSAEPDVEVIDLDGDEDFVVLGCDGLWDNLTEDDVALTIYTEIKKNPDNYQSIATNLCTFAKEQGSRDNISVIVVYLKDPHLIATQTWPSAIQQNITTASTSSSSTSIMDNLYDQMPNEVVPPNSATMDALGNTNQDIFNNPFGDFNNQQFINDVNNITNGKSTEITDIVMQQQQQQSDNDFCNNITTTVDATIKATMMNAMNDNNIMMCDNKNENEEMQPEHELQQEHDIDADTITNNLNNLNYNKANNGNDLIMDDEMAESPDQEQEEMSSPDQHHNVLILNNDNNNNSGDNQFDGHDFGPETDVDAIDMMAQLGNMESAMKEQIQSEFKETEDFTDRASGAVVDAFSSFGGAVKNIGSATADLYGSLEHKIFGQLSLQNPDLMMGNNPFADSSNDDMEHMAVVSEEFIDNKLVDNMESLIDNVKQEVCDFNEKKDFSFDRENSEKDMDNCSGAIASENVLFNLNNYEVTADEDVAMEQSQQADDIGSNNSTNVVPTENVVIGESGGEESEDEWNYIKVDKKLDVETVVEETHEQIIAESPSVEETLLKEQLENTEQVKEEGIAEIKKEEFAVEEPNIELKETESLTDRDIITEEAEILQKKIEVLESPLEVEKDLTVEKEESEEESLDQLEEEKQSREEVEKDLQLDEEIDIDCDKISAEEMASQLNPDAKEFVPVSPVRSGHSSPFENGNGIVNPMLTNLDDVVSQSPRKGEYQQMDNIQVPDENDFDQEANSRPHEVKLVGQNGNHKRSDSFGSNGYEELNLKESMQRDDKLDYEYKDEIEQPSAPSAFFEESQISIQANFGDDTMASDYKQLESSFDQYSSTFNNKIEDPMNRSFYEGRDDNIMSEFAAQSSDILNKVQPIPSFDDFDTLDQRPEADHGFGESDKPESDLMEAVEQIEEALVSKTLESAAMDTSDQFESEKFVENIKSGNGVFDKYNECGLSPTAPEFSTNLIQTVHETFMNDKPVLEQISDSNLESMVNLIDNTQAESDFCMQSNDMKNIPETMEPPSTPAVGFEPELTEKTSESVVNKLAENLEALNVDEVKPEEVLAAAAVISAGIAAVGIVAAKKKPAATKPEIKKAPAKTNPAPAKTNPVPAKTNPVPAKRVAPTATKAPAPAKPIAVASKTAAPKSSSAAPARTLAAKPAVTTAAARPKSAPSVPAPIKKTASSTSSANKSSIEAKPTPATRTAMVPKKPLATSTTSTAAKPPPKTATAITKPKVPIAPIERKPLASSATTTRAPVKPTTLATKPKLSNGSSTLKATSPTKPMSVRLSMSTTIGGAEKSTKDAANKQVLNRSVGSASSTTRVAPKSTTTIKKTTELKSPAGPAKTTITSTRTTTLSAVGAKKPLSTTTSRTTTTTVKKSPASKVAPQPAPIAKKPSPIGRQPINKTTTTTTVEKKVLNGDVVKEQIITTTTTTGSDNFEDLLKEQLVMEMNGMNGHQNGDMGELIKENGGDAKEGDIVNNMIVIDSAAD